MKWLLALPIIVPLITAALSLLVGRSRALQRLLGIAGALGPLALFIDWRKRRGRELTEV